VKAAFGLTQGMQFEVVPTIVSGIELSANGQKLAWSITEYLGALEKSVGELLHEQLKSAPVVNEKSSNEL
jgi:F-type H+-transporting ATPase subunit b